MKTPLLLVAALSVAAMPLEALAVRQDVNDTATVRPAPSGQVLETVTIRAIRGDAAAPIAQTTRTRAQIMESYAGQEVPMLLTAFPSVTATTDAGVASGYTYFRIRGLDQTRVNVTIDGVPLNEPEDQGFYSVNLADFANNVQSVQVQRGVGTSSNGTAAYAGSVNFESIALGSAKRGGEIELTEGAYDTRRVSIAARSGLTSHRLSGYLRMSGQHTDGYRYASGNDSRSLFASGGYFGARHVLKAMLMSGDARNELAYIASDAEDISRDPRTNALSSHERDHFRQDVASISHALALGTTAALTTTIYHNRLHGGYDVLAAPDMLRFNVGSRWTGMVSTLHATRDRLTLDGGVHLSDYRRDHWLTVAPDASSRLYDNAGVKREASGFGKAAFRVGRATVFADAQLRTARFTYVPSANAGVSRAPIQWTFLNPKIGTTVRLSTSWSTFASIGRNGREPARSDMFAGYDDMDAGNASFIGPFDRVRPEYVTDGEAGVAYAGSRTSLRANGYWMQFHDEITPIGRLSTIGLPLRKNVASSRRRGVEIETSVHPSKWLDASLTANASANRIRGYTDDQTGVTYRNVEPLLTPRIQFGHDIASRARSWLSLGAEGRYAGRSYLANTEDARFIAPAFYAADLSVTLGSGARHVLVQLNNAFDVRAFPGGYTDGARSYYYVLAGRHLSATAHWGF